MCFIPLFHNLCVNRQHFCSYLYSESSNYTNNAKNGLLLLLNILDQVGQNFGFIMYLLPSLISQLAHARIHA